MQYSVPQFIEVEDKLIAGLTLKQFLFILAGGLFSLGLWSIFKFSFVFFVLAVPIVLVSLGFAFGKYNGRPLIANVSGAVKFFSAPRVRVFSRTGEKSAMLTKKTEPQVRHALSPDEAEPVSSRLRKLAYFLDQKTAEEERLIHSGEMKGKWLNQI